MEGHINSNEQGDPSSYPPIPCEKAPQSPLKPSEKYNLSQTEDMPTVSKQCKAPGRKQLCPDSGDTLTPIDIVLLVPSYCPDTDNIYAVAVSLRHGQNLCLRFWKENCMGDKNRSHDLLFAYSEQLGAVTTL